jgi:two-component system, OmpR family, sensor kinase
MKLPELPSLSLPVLEVPKLGLASFRRRILFRLVFALLAIGTVALALVLLKEEKERAYQNYGLGFQKTHAEIIAQLRHPAGQLALINARRQAVDPAILSPLVLPYGGLDFDDQNKVQQAVETANCSILYPDDSRLCVAIGSNPFAGGFIYLVSQFSASELSPRERGVLDLAGVHRARVSLRMPSEKVTWIAPLEISAEAGSAGMKGRLAGFSPATELLERETRPQRDFRGLLWQSPRCEDAAAVEPCQRRTQLSIRLPVESFREAIVGKARPVWPPTDLDSHAITLQFIGPNGQTLFDSHRAGAIRPLSLPDLSRGLQSGETLTIRKSNEPTSDAFVYKAKDTASELSSPLLLSLIARLPIDTPQLPAPAIDKIRTAVGSYEVKLASDGRGLERGLAVVATRMAWYVGAMLSAILVAWILIEIGLIRRITELTRRAATVSHNVQDERVSSSIAQLDVSDLRGKDELGILAGGLSDLLQRVKDDWQQGQIRAQKEKDMWHAVGHEIMSPLQSLMVLHADAKDPSHRYIQRMQQAVKVLYGQASPSEAIESANLNLSQLELVSFLKTVADNAPFAGVEQVELHTALVQCPVRADEFSLEDVVTHILRNAQRFRTTGTAIRMQLSATEEQAMVCIRNTGPHIAADQLSTIFEYGVSSQTDGDAPASEHRGQGLFVAKTYMAKMGGTIHAENTSEGVNFVLLLRRSLA